MNIIFVFLITLFSTAGGASDPYSIDPFPIYNFDIDIYAPHKKTSNIGNLEKELVFDLMRKNISIDSSFNKNYHPLCKKNRDLILEKGVKWGVHWHFDGAEGRAFLSENDVQIYLKASKITFSNLDEGLSFEHNQSVEDLINTPLGTFSNHPHLNLEILNMQHCFDESSPFEEIESINSLTVDICLDQRGGTFDFGCNIKEIKIRESGGSGTIERISLGVGVETFITGAHMDSFWETHTLDFSEAADLKSLTVGFGMFDLSHIFLPSVRKTMDTLHILSSMECSQFRTLLKDIKVKNLMLTMPSHSLLDVESFIDLLINNNENISIILEDNYCIHDRFLNFNAPNGVFADFDACREAFPLLPQDFFTTHQPLFYFSFKDESYSDRLTNRNANGYLFEESHLIIGRLSDDNMIYIFQYQTDSFERIKEISDIIKSTDKVSLFCNILS